MIDECAEKFIAFTDFGYFTGAILGCCLENYMNGKMEDVLYRCKSYFPGLKSHTDIDIICKYCIFLYFQKGDDKKRHGKLEWNNFIYDFREHKEGLIYSTSDFGNTQAINNSDKNVLEEEAHNERYGNVLENNKIKDFLKNENIKENEGIISNEGKLESKMKTELIKTPELADMTCILEKTKN